MSAESINYDFIYDDPVPIIDGYVTIKVGTGPNAIIVKQRVKQLKGKGTYDADGLVIPGEEHLEYLNWMLANMKHPERLSSMDIFEKINHARKLQSLAKNQTYIPIRQSTHIRIISELLRKACIYIPKMEGKKPLYSIIPDYCYKVVTENKF